VGRREPLWLQAAGSVTRSPGWRCPLQYRGRSGPRPKARWRSCRGVGRRVRAEGATQATPLPPLPPLPPLSPLPPLPPPSCRRHRATDAVRLLRVSVRARASRRACWWIASRVARPSLALRAMAVPARAQPLAWPASIGCRCATSRVVRACRPAAASPGSTAESTATLACRQRRHGLHSTVCVGAAFACAYVWPGRRAGCGERCGKRPAKLLLEVEVGVEREQDEPVAEDRLRHGDWQYCERRQAKAGAKDVEK
jgi:hypothetical protein